MLLKGQPRPGHIQSFPTGNDGNAWHSHPGRVNSASVSLPKGKGKGMPAALLVTGVDGFLVALSPNPQMKPGFWEEPLLGRDRQSASPNPQHPSAHLEQLPKDSLHPPDKLWSSLW